MPRGQSPTLTADPIASLALKCVARLAIDNQVAVIVVALSPDGDCQVRSNVDLEAIVPILLGAIETVNMPDLVGKEQLPESV